ncbi:hypothetical protein EDB19DRAFT_199889 [Suillus lakei]|nr:hypothetical protein EDB19DRAFT_199889 [Suillus lakei]
MHFFSKGALDLPSLFGSILSDLHHKRITSLLFRTKGEVVLQGRADAARKRLEPTIVKDVADGNSLPEEEIVGPILPVVPVDCFKFEAGNRLLSMHGKLSSQNPTRLIDRTTISSTGSVRF